MTILDDTSKWTEQEGTLYHLLMHTPEQVWKAAYEPQLTGESRNAAGACLFGAGAGLFAAQMAQRWLPVTGELTVSAEAPQELPNNWLRIQLVAPGEAVHPLAEAVIAPEGTETTCELAGFYPALPAAATLGAMFFSAVSLLQRCDLLDNAEEVARPIVGMLMQKAGAVAVGLESELNMAKNMAADLRDAKLLFVPLSPELEPAANWARMQVNRITGKPAAALCAADARDAETLSAWSDWRPVLLSKLDANGLPRRHDSLPEQLHGAHTMYAEGSRDLEVFFSLVYPLALVTFYISVLQKHQTD